MKIKAKISFCGVISMHQGETRDIGDVKTAKDLIAAGYVEEVKKKAAQKNES